MNITERAAKINEHLNHFKTSGICHTPKRGLDMVLSYQDLIGRATMGELRQIETDMPEDQRKMFLFANLQTLDHDAAVEIFRKTIGARKIYAQYELETAEIRKEEEKQNARANELTERDRLLTAKEFECISKIDTLERQARNMASRIDSLVDTHDATCREYREYRQTMAATLAEISKENADLQAVKRVLQGMSL
jgi:hypothetical protein